jgi:hypothetical protein
MPTAPSTTARNRAYARLAAAHSDEFADLLVAERVALGLTPTPRTGQHTPRVPVPDLLRAFKPLPLYRALGVSGATWHAWMKAGIPDGLQADVAAACGVPVELLWPPVGEAKPTTRSKVREIKPPAPHPCKCGKRFDTRDELARHRLDLDHYDEDEDVA